MKAAILFANGTEEIEAVTPIDVLRRAKVDCDVVSVNGEYPVGSHGITIKADKTIENTDLSVYDAIVIPGGMPGATNISENRLAIDGISCAVKNGKLVCAICASPAVVLAKHGLIEGNATCYPASEFINCVSAVGTYVNEDVVVDGNIITANGPKSALKFALEICKKLNLTPAF